MDQPTDAHPRVVTRLRISPALSRRSSSVEYLDAEGSHSVTPRAAGQHSAAQPQPPPLAKFSAGKTRDVPPLPVPDRPAPSTRNLSGSGPIEQRMHFSTPPTDSKPPMVQRRNSPSTLPEQPVSTRVQLGGMAALQRDLQECRLQNEALRQKHETTVASLEAELKQKLSVEQELRQQLERQQQQLLYKQEQEEAQGQGGSTTTTVPDDSPIATGSAVEQVAVEPRSDYKVETADKAILTEPDEELVQARNASEALARQLDQVQQEKQQLLAQLEQEKQHFLAQAAQEDRSAEHSSLGAESQLRAALTKAGGVSTAELRAAIGATAALLEEARRELAAQELRETRAAYELLHSATEGDDEGILESTIEHARETQVDEEELERATSKLEALRALTPEERAAKEADKARVDGKKEAFLLTRRDDAAALRPLLEGHCGEKGWRTWKDQAGRSLHAYALFHKAQRVQRLLSTLDEQDDRPTTGATLLRASHKHGPVELFKPPASLDDGVDLPCGKISPKSVLVSEADTKRRSPVGPTNARKGFIGAKTVVEPPSPRCSEEEAETMKAPAFRAAVQNDTAKLAEVLERVPRSIWKAWNNKAGKDLLTLSEERGSSAAYAMLARSLGLLQDRKFEAFQEREDVWVLVPGEVQPRRATVTKDADADSNYVSVEFWDGDAPATEVEHSLVCKASA